MPRHHKFHNGIDRGEGDGVNPDLSVQKHLNSLSHALNIASIG